MVLIIYANPKDKGHCATILENVIKELENKKQEYELINLYKIDFDVRLKKEEEFGEKKFPEVKIYQEKVKKADKLIFIYPVWWNNMPAILKGFMDRIFSAKFAFKYKKVFGIGIPIGLLKGKKAVVFITSGSPKFLFSIIQRRRGATVFTFDILSFCGIKNKYFHYGKAIDINDESRAKLGKLAKKGVKWLLR